MRRSPLPVFLLAVMAVIALSSVESRAAGLLVPRDGSAPIAVRSHRITAELRDGLARTTCRQTFVNSTNRVLEAVYVFRLSVFPVVPHEETVVELTWIELVPLSQGSFGTPTRSRPNVGPGERDRL